MSDSIDLPYTSDEIYSTLYNGLKFSDSLDIKLANIANLITDLEAKDLILEIDNIIQSALTKEDIFIGMDSLQNEIVGFDKCDSIALAGVIHITKYSTCIWWDYAPNYINDSIRGSNHNSLRDRTIFCPKAAIAADAVTVEGYLQDSLIAWNSGGWLATIVAPATVPLVTGWIAMGGLTSGIGSV